MIRDGVGAIVLDSDALSGPMEDPLLIPWAELNLGVDMERLRESRSVLIRSSFGSDSKKRGSLMRKNEDARETLHLQRLFWKYAEDDGVNEKVMITELRENNLILMLILGVNFYLVCSLLQEFSPTSIVLEGEEFRNFTDAKRKEKADRKTVMGSASPLDKLLLVQSLHQKGQVVAFMGTRTVEFPSLKEAYVGLFMGKNNSAMAKESCDINIPNGSFASIVEVLLIGRSNYQNIRKFLHLELTTSNSGILLTLVITFFLGDTPLTPLQLFMVNLMVGTLAALDLLTETPTQDVLEMQPINQTQPIITKSMRWNIFAQVCYQGMVLLIFQFIKDKNILGMDRKVKKAMVFNGFVLCLVFNQFNARAPEKKNMFKGIIGSHWFLLSVGFPIILEVLLMEFAEKFTGFPRLNKTQWLACILFAIMSWPIDYAVKCISSFFTNRSIGVPSCLTSTGLLQSTPSTSLCQLPTPLMNV
ncbi:hypothetical protein MKX01_020082 [Papaver californicum]|nr:hypothetical protein MKX01_020082 [Papaver californicum]